MGGSGNPGFLPRGGGGRILTMGRGGRFFPKGADFARGEQILSSLDQKFTNNSLKKCRTGGDAGQVRCSSGGMQNRSDAGQLGCRTGVMQDRSDAEQE